MARVRSAIPRHLAIASILLPILRRDPERQRSIGDLAAELGVRKRDVMPALGHVIAKGWCAKKGEKVWITEAGVKVVDDNKPEEEKRSGVVRASELTHGQLAELARQAEREAGLR